LVYVFCIGIGLGLVMITLVEIQALTSIKSMTQKSGGVWPRGNVCKLQIEEIANYESFGQILKNSEAQKEWHENNSPNWPDNDAWKSMRERAYLCLNALDSLHIGLTPI
jgi:hypothetical protein